MTKKVPCQKCGKEILPTTAEITGGVCMPCAPSLPEDERVHGANLIPYGIRPVPGCRVAITAAVLFPFCTLMLCRIPFQLTWWLTIPLLFASPAVGLVIGGWWSQFRHRQMRHRRLAKPIPKVDPDEGLVDCVELPEPDQRSPELFVDWEKLKFKPPYFDEEFFLFQEEFEGGRCATVEPMGLRFYFGAKTGTRLAAIDCELDGYPVQAANARFILNAIGFPFCVGDQIPDRRELHRVTNGSRWEMQEVKGGKSWETVTGEFTISLITNATGLIECISVINGTVIRDNLYGDDDPLGLGPIL